MSVDVQLRGTLLYRDIENPKKTSIIEAVASLFRNKDYSVVLLTVDGKRGNHWITRAVTDEMINPDFMSSILFSNAIDAGGASDAYVVFLCAGRSMNDISSALANKNLYDTRSRRTLADQSIGSVLYRESDCCGYNFIMSPRHESLTCDLLNLCGDISDQ